MSHAEVASYPVLVAAPGMEISESARLSTIAFRVPSAGASLGLAQPHGPHRVQIFDLEHGFILPPGSFSMLEAQYGVIVRLRASPHLTYLNWSGVNALLPDLDRILEQSNWKRRSQRLVEDLLRRIERRGEDVSTTWSARDWSASVWVRRAVEASSVEGRVLQLREDAFLITLLVQAEALKLG